MTAVIFVAAWLACGAVGYFLTRWWWTASFDWTTSERALGLLFALAGPLNLGTGLLLAGIEALAGATNKRVLKERRR